MHRIKNPENPVNPVQRRQTTQHASVSARRDSGYTVGHRDL